MSKIFEEAIADAKMLKRVAEENAKKAILESVTPKIKEFIEEQLLEGGKEENSEEDESDDKDEAVNDLEETVYLDESALSSIINLLGEDVLDSLNESKSKTALINSVKGAIAGMDPQERETLLNTSNRINERANNLSSKKGESMSRKYYEVDLRTLRESLNELEEEESENESMENQMDDDMLGELARLFEQDEEADAGEELPLEDDLGGEADAGGDTLLKSEVEAEIEELIASLGLNVGGEQEDAVEGAEELDLGAFEELDAEEPAEEPAEDALNEMIDVDPTILRQEINRIKRMMSESSGASQSKVAHHFGGKGTGNAGHKNAFGGSGAKKLGYAKSFGGAAPGKDAFTDPPQINKLNEAIRNLSRQNRAQAEKLNKYRGAVSSLREQLEELNLFNAKLLYVNKLLQNKSLNESQKKSVIKALDEAASLQEAKSLYTSLTQTLGKSDKRSTLSESRILGSSSRTVTSAQTNVSKNDELSRWQRLAGL